MCHKENKRWQRNKEWLRYYFCIHFTYEETEDNRSGELFKATQLVSSGFKLRSESEVVCNHYPVLSVQFPEKSENLENR